MAAIDDGIRPGLEVAEDEPGHLVIQLAGELDIVSVERLESQMAELLRRSPEAVALNLVDLTFMDSSGVALLLRLTNQFGPVEVRGANAQVQRVIETLGLSQILRMERAG